MAEKLIAVETTTGLWKTGGAPAPTESAEIIPIPEARVTGNSVRIGQTNFDGASFILRRRTQFNRIIFAITTVVTAPTVKILVYQASDGGSGVASLIATVSAFAVATGTNIATPSEGLITAPAGLIYVLFGRDSVGGSATFRTYLNNAIDLWNENVDADTHPVTFTTALATSTTPATFNPKESGDADQTTVDTVMSLRLKKV